MELSVSEQDFSVAERHRESLFRLLVESVKDYAIFLLDPTGYILSWNEGAERIKGYRAAEIIGKHFSIFYTAREVQHGKPDYALRVAANEGHWEDEGWRVRKDGSQFWASVVITALYDSNHALIGFAKVTRDLTDRRRAEEERAQLLELEHTARMKSEMLVERLQAIQSVTEAALSRLNLDDLLTHLLDRVAEILAVDTVTVLLLEAETKTLRPRAVKGGDEAVEHAVPIPIGVGFAGRIAADQHALVVEDVDRADVMHPIVRPQGIRSLLGVPLNVENRVIGVLQVGSRRRRQFNEQDIELLRIVADRTALVIENAHLADAAYSARREAQVAEATVQARDEFISIAAHELKTPLTSLRLAAQTVLRQLQQGKVPDAVALQRSLGIVDLQAGRLSRLVTQLLDTVRAQAGRLKMESTDVDLVQVVRAVVDQIRPRAGDHDIEVRGPDSLHAQVDSLRFEQVLINLLDNAIKFSPGGGAIVVDLEHVGQDHVRVRVRDHGIGVPPEHRPHLFERFYQAHSTDHRSGMGLGLYICREIVERHGGRIHAEFPDDGGTCFVIDLPVRAEDALPVDAA